MPLTDKINLQVQRNFAQANELSYRFRITGFESTSIDLANYRIVAYFFSNFERSQIDLGANFAGFAFGGNGTSGSVNADITAIFYDAESNLPPRVSPTSFNAIPGLFNVKFQIGLTGGVINAPNTGFQNLDVRFRSDSFRNFQQLNGIDRDYELSYSRTESTAFVDDPTFILEFFDGTDWLKVEEVLDDTGTPDPNTGVYPYGENIDDTQLDHIILQPDFDSQLDGRNPDTHIGTAESLEIGYRADDGQHIRPLFSFKLSDQLPSNAVISQAFLYTRVERFNQSNVNLEIVRVTNGPVVNNEATWNEYSTGNTWNTPGGDLGVQEDLINIPNGFPLLENYLIWDVTNFATDTINDNANNSFENLIIKYETESPGRIENQVLISSAEEVEESFRPFLVVAGVATNFIENRRRIIII